MSSCPCGSDKNYEECCGLYISGKEKAPTAEALMRSRYSAFVKADVDYIVNTTHPDHREDMDVDEIKNWAENSDWKGLEILGTRDGLEGDEEGWVEFVAKYEFDGTAQNHHELSKFNKKYGTWYFVDGKVQGGTLVRTQPKVGRNEPCPCGSGKKYKKCCGR